jgi:hypothetical protein
MRGADRASREPMSVNITPIMNSAICRPRRCCQTVQCVAKPEDHDAVGKVRRCKPIDFIFRDKDPRCRQHQRGEVSPPEPPFTCRNFASEYSASSEPVSAPSVQALLRSQSESSDWSFGTITTASQLKHSNVRSFVSRPAELMRTSIGARQFWQG